MKKNSVAMVMIACGLYCGAAANLGASPLSQATSKAGSERADREIMQKIRKAVVADKTLSMFAHNVKIVARDGKVTLRGPRAVRGRKADCGRNGSCRSGRRKCDQ